MNALVVLGLADVELAKFEAWRLILLVLVCASMVLGFDGFVRWLAGRGAFRKATVGRTPGEFEYIGIAMGKNLHRGCLGLAKSKTHVIGFGLGGGLIFEAERKGLRTTRVKSSDVPSVWHVTWEVGTEPRQMAMTLRDPLKLTG